MINDLGGKIILVTGATGGIGKVISDTLEYYHATVLRASKNGPSQFTCDITNKHAVVDMFSTIKDEYGVLDVLVNNAGVTILKPMIEFTEEEYDHVMDTNIKGTFFCSQEAMIMMKDQHTGNIVNISSVAGHTGGIVPDQSVYAASKAAITCLTKTMARDMAPYGVRVNCIAPSLVNAGIIRHYSKDKIEAFEKSCPFGRLGGPIDVANAVLFLITDLSSYITGQTIHVNGGNYM